MQLDAMSAGLQREMRSRVRVLDLCCGTRSVRRAFPVVFRHLKVAYTGVDIDPDTGADIVEDLMTWDYRAHGAPGHYDIVMAWPDCKQFSDARRTRPEPAEHAAAVELVKRCLEIIAYFRPKLWALENPAGRKRFALRNQEFMRAHERFMKLTTFCAYGFVYRKPTCVWTNAEVELRRCTPETPCHHERVHGKHLRTVSKFPLSVRHSVPVAMLCDLLEAFVYGTVTEDWPVVPDADGCRRQLSMG